MSAPSSRRPFQEVAIIGGGVLGAATAYYLARSGCKVSLFERKTIGAEQSGRALGFLRCQGRHLRELPLALEAAKMWTALESELSASFEFQKNGSLLVADTEADQALLRASHARAVAAGSNAKLLDVEEISRLLPTAVRSWPLGVWTPEDATADPTSVTQAFARAAERHGAVLHAGAAVDRILVRDNRVIGLSINGGTVEVPAVLCACGVATNALLRPLGATVPLQVVRSPVVEVQMKTRFFNVALWTPQASMRFRPDGRLVLASGYGGEPPDHDLTLESALNFPAFAATYISGHHRPRLSLGAEFLKNRQSFGSKASSIFSGEPPVNHRQINGRLAFLRTAFPNDAAFMIELRRWSGRIDASPDLLPMIGPIPDIEGLVVAAGFSSHGLGIAPLLAKGLAHHFAQGASPAILSALDLDRVRTRSYAHDPGAL